MIYAFLYHMKMALARLKMITRGLHITVSVTSMVLIQMKGKAHEGKATERSPPDNLTQWIRQLFKNTFKSLINEDLAIDIEKYQGVLEHALSKVDFSVGIGIYMLPSKLNLAIGKKEGYNSKIIVNNTGMKIGSNKDINRDHKKFPVVKPNVA